jgi:hypothetical protein
MLFTFKGGALAGPGNSLRTSLAPAATWWPIGVRATHVFPANGDPFFADVQDVYDDIGEGLPPDAPWWRPEDLPADRDEIERSGLFEVVLVRRFDWQVSYNADEYLRLLDTFSGHIAMRAWQRARLHDEIRRRLGRRPDGRLDRHWGAVLHVAAGLAG